MEKRSPIAVALLPLVTFGIYGLYWQIVTKGELNAKGAQIPTAWLLIVPIANIWWLWKYSEGAEKVSGGKVQAVLTFLLLWIVGSIGAAIVQHLFNELTPVAATPSAAPAPVQAIPPTPIPPTPPVAPTPPTPPSPVV